MPAQRPTRLTLLPFPQRWEAGGLRVRFLCLPKGDPEAPLGAEPSFATANLVFEARVIGSLAHTPLSAETTPVGPLVLNNPPVNKTALLNELTRHFRIVTAPPPVGVPGQGSAFRKPVTASYRSLTGNRQLSPFMVEDDDFECALHEAHASQPPKPVMLDDSVTWGKLIALVLRQPRLAEACGFIGECIVTPPDPAFFAAGGWLYIALDPSSDYAAAGPGLTSVYAARIPPLNDDRPVYAAVLFPVDGPQPIDDVYREAERYSSGFARMVHGAQIDDRGDAVSLAWDDEQVAEWINRQVDPAVDSPMGTSGYRVDVRLQGSADWTSLQRVASVGNLVIGPLDIGAFAGDAVVEVVPAQISRSRAGQYWMPGYFATWRGGSLALTDPELTGLHEDPRLDPALAQHRLGREKTLVPVDDKAVPLEYGRTYEFRVRLADLTRGGPEAEEVVPLAADSVATILFRRKRRPGQINVLARPEIGNPRLKIAKPQLGYPDALYTGQVSFADLRADFLVEKPEGLQREFSVPDPDVSTVAIRVEVCGLGGDFAPWLLLYETSRDFNAGELTLDLDLLDLNTVDELAAAQPGSGPLAIPSARDVRFTLTAMGHTRPNYFATEESRTGVPITVEVRAGAAAEAALFAPMDLPVRAFYFQPPPGDGSVASPVERLALELALVSSGLTVSAQPGRRAVFACSRSLHHTLSGEFSSLTFASNAELVQRWVNVLRFTIDRDWTWDGLADAGIEVRRVVERAGMADLDELAGTIQFSRSLAPAARQGVADDVRAPQRASTDVWFFDAFDPKPPVEPAPAPPHFPSEITFRYQLRTTFRGVVDVPEPVMLDALLVPVTTPPAQTAKLVSAGIALSPYVPADDYSSTDVRERSLWLEFDRAPEDAQDTYFVRVLAEAPDPMLTDVDIREVREAPLPIDPEWMRLIVPRQPRDDNGLSAMQRLRQSSADGRHWIVPFPAGVQSSSPELFGMYTYEIRLGHTEERWSTAQGRFGPALRVAGVQHPVPPLVCQAARTANMIRVRATYATPVHQGRNVRPPTPKTTLWALLYARVRQTDGASYRNLLLTRTRLRPPGNALGLAFGEVDAAVLFGEGLFEVGSVVELLKQAGLPHDADLTTLAVEFMTDPRMQDVAPDPAGAHLGFARMLRVSPLVPVPGAC